jgi:multimeric flavodoxin WrbA
VREIRTLVVYYSRSGHTRAVAEEIARSFSGAEVEEIRDTVDRAGLRGYWRSFRDAMRKRTTTLVNPGRNVGDYDLVVVGGPVWVGAPSSPVRTWLIAHAGELHAVAFFLTHGGSARDRVFGALAALSGRFPLAVVSVRERELGTPEAGARIAAFADEVRVRMSAAGLRLVKTEKAPVG